MLPLLFALVGCGTSPEEVRRPEGLHPLPIALLLAEIDAQRSRPRIYNFWATWCGPCMAELPALREFGESHPEVDLIFVNVDMPSLYSTKVKPTIKRMKLEAFEQLALDEGDPAHALNQLPGWPNSIPVTLIVSAKGERVQQFNTRVNERMLVHGIEKMR